VVGEKEQTDKTVTLESRAGSKETFQVSAASEKLNQEIQSRR